MLKLSSNVGDVYPKVLKLSSEVSECKPLVQGRAAPARGAVAGGHHRRGQGALLLLHHDQVNPYVRRVVYIIRR